MRTIWRTIWCQDLIDAGLRPASCCESCHEDEEEYGYSLCGLDDPENPLIEVGAICCKVSQVLQAMPEEERKAIVKQAIEKVKSE